MNILWPYTYILKFRSVDQGYVVKTERWSRSGDHAAAQVPIYMNFIYFVLTCYYYNYNIQLFPEGEMNSGGYIPRHEASRYISNCSSPTLRGIVVLVFTKSDG